MMRIVETLKSPQENNGLYFLRVNLNGQVKEQTTDEAGYNILLAQTEIYTLLFSKGCSEDEIAGIFDRVSKLCARFFEDGVTEGINIGYKQATIDPDRG